LDVGADVGDGDIEEVGFDGGVDDGDFAVTLGGLDDIDDGDLQRATPFDDATPKLKEEGEVGVCGTEICHEGAKTAPVVVAITHRVSSAEIEPFEGWEEVGVVFLDVGEEVFESIKPLIAEGVKVESLKESGILGVA